MLCENNRIEICFLSIFLSLIQKYLNPLKSQENASLIETQTVDEIFLHLNMVPTILNIHQQFLEAFRSRLETWDATQRIGDAFVQVVCVQCVSLHLRN